MRSHQILVSETLSAEFGTVLETGEHMLLICREAGGLVAVHMSELSGLIAALTELQTIYHADHGDAVDSDERG